MKKLLAIALSAAMLLSLTACGNTPADDAGTSDVSTGDTSVTDPADTGSSDEVIEPEEPVEEDIKPIDLLNTVWSGYDEDDKFAAAGGESMDGPGEMTGDFGSAETVETMLLLPAADFDKVSDIACLMHMMNANTFTCGVYSVVDSADTETITSDIHDKIIYNQWMCGFPEKMFVATYNNCIISAFGNGEIMDIFKENLTAAYPDVSFVYEEDLLCIGG